MQATLFGGILGGMSTTELILVVVVILVLFGAKKIPQFARGLGQGIREFKDAASSAKKDVNEEVRSVDNAVQSNPQNPA